MLALKLTMRPRIKPQMEIIKKSMKNCESEKEKLKGITDPHIA